jgi:hypothetical protein
MSIPKGDWREAATAEYVDRRRLAAKRREKYAQSIANMQRKMAEADAEIADLDRGAKVFGLAIPEGVRIADAAHVEPTNLQRMSADQHGRQFKDIALDVLAKAYPHPLKALDVQRAAEAELGRSFHWKTAGMTLYRLKQDGLVRRSGQNWFWVSEAERSAELDAVVEAAVNAMMDAEKLDAQQDDLLGRAGVLEDIL